MSSESVRCFVIGPIGSSLAPPGSDARKVYEDALEVLEQVIAPACAEVGLVAVRADAISATGDLTELIFRHLRDDEVVIADLTGANPNVMYELGLRHTVDKLTIQLGEFDSLPFDIGSIRTIQFSRSPHGLVQARKNLTNALTVGLGDKGDLLPATRIWLEKGSAEAETDLPASNLPDLAPTMDPPGVLEGVAEVEKLLPELTHITSDIAEEVTNLGERAQRLSPDIAALNETNASAAQRLAVIDKFAALIDEPASNLDRLSFEFADRMDRINDHVNGILQFWETQPAKAGNEALPFLDSLSSLAVSARTGMDGLGSLVPTLRAMAGLSRTLRGPVNKIVGAVNRLVSSMEIVDSWASDAASLRAEAPSV